MLSAVARTCLVSVLLAAASTRADPTASPVSSPATAALERPALRCEPAPDLRLHTAAAASPAAFQAESSRRHLPVPLQMDDQAPLRTDLRRSRRIPLVVMRDTPTSAVFVGLDRRGVAGLHFQQKAGRERGRPVPTMIGPARSDGN